jgi:hypothetical protein
MQLLLAFVINSLLVAVVVMVHYGILHQIVKILPRFTFAHSLRIVFGVFGALIAHVIEIWIFALGYYFKSQGSGWGSLEGNFDGTLLDCVYFSFTVYTTVGFGDIEPLGYIRYLTGIESLAGLVLITWTASFLYLEMQRHWDQR